MTREGGGLDEEELISNESSSLAREPKDAKTSSSKHQHSTNEEVKPANSIIQCQNDDISQPKSSKHSQAQ